MYSRFNSSTEMSPISPTPKAGGFASGGAALLPIVGPAMDTAKLYQAGQGTGMANLDALMQVKNFAEGLGPQMPQGLNIQKPEIDQGAMGRRMAALNQAPLQQLRQGIDSLRFVESPEQRAALAKPLLQAEYVARRQGGA